MPPKTRLLFFKKANAYVLHHSPDNTHSTPCTVLYSYDRPAIAYYPLSGQIIFYPTLSAWTLRHARAFLAEYVGLQTDTIISAIKFMQSNPSSLSVTITTTNDTVGDLTISAI